MKIVPFNPYNALAAIKINLSYTNCSLCQNEQNYNKLSQLHLWSQFTTIIKNGVGSGASQSEDYMSGMSK